ncbi:arsenite methyltransferase [Halorubrum sp. Boch-26]|uniref:arsenite methyltransferase n=1 Tax=Halorubrum sp. Boch-26 TaxID=2994426 RepID=UPI002468AE86|nr:arsenite methyltransferase [Halorubrum sp. Boch-26]
MSDREEAGGDPSGDAIDPAEQRRVVRERYGGIAASAPESDAGCCDAGSGGSTECCEGDESDAVDPDGASLRLGYDPADVDAVAEGANLGLGCGNPTAIAALDAGETVLDLGSGAGFDCFLAAREVAPDGRVIGVDMTPEMVERARENVAKNDAEDVEFRLGEIEHLPVADATVDVVISNCVINLSPRKPQVFREAFRVLRPGGRLAVSDVVQTAPFPDDVRLDPSSVSACVAGAATIDETESALADAGFTEVAIDPKAESESFIRDWDADRDPSEYVVSAAIEARKPR